MSEHVDVRLDDGRYLRVFTNGDVYIRTVKDVAAGWGGLRVLALWIDPAASVEKPA